MINHHLAILIEHDRGELRELKNWTFAEFQFSLYVYLLSEYGVYSIQTGTST